MKNNDTPSTRLYYLDWLRVIAMLGVFFYHNAMFFNEFSDWHIKNAANNMFASAFNAFTVQWGMPLFFLLSGAGTYLALKVINARQYTLERTLRLLIPFIFGMLVIVVPQAYFAAKFNGIAVEGNFFQMYVQYLKTLPDLETYHLWFLEQLFIFSVITLPLFIYAGKLKKIVAPGIANIFDNPWLILSIILLVTALINAFVYPSGYWGNRESGGWNILSNLIFYISGYIIFSNERIIRSIGKLKWISLVIGIAGMVGLVIIFLDELTNLTESYGTAKFILSQFVQSINTWLWLFVIVGFASRFLTNTNKFLKYANSAVLPFYILHQTIIIVIGYYVVQWDSGIGIKYLTISSTSFIAVMIIYELLVRRINVLRFLFGMRLNRKKPAA